MNVKRIALIGAVALVVLGCVIAAGCTAQSNTQKDNVIGSWTLENGTAAGLLDGTKVVFNEDLTGTMTAGDKVFKFTWKKTEDGKYQVSREDGAQAIWIPDSAANIMKNPAGVILKKN